MSPKNVRLFRLMLLCLEDRTTPSAGMLDPSFGDGGRVSTHWQSASGGQSVAIDHLGRTVVAGEASNNFAIARYTPAGLLDTSFGGTGKVLVDFNPGYVDGAMGVAMDSMGRIVVAGYAAQEGTSNYVGAIIRLTDSGKLDTSFDGDGKQTVAFGTSVEMRDVAIDSFDRIVIAGWGYDSTVQFSYFAIARLTVDLPPTLVPAL